MKIKPCPLKNKKLACDKCEAEEEMEKVMEKFAQEKTCELPQKGAVMEIWLCPYAEEIARMNDPFYKELSNNETDKVNEFQTPRLCPAAQCNDRIGLYCLNPKIKEEKK